MPYTLSIHVTNQVVEIAENVDTEESGTDCKNIEVELVIGKNTQVTDTYRSNKY